MTPHNKTKTGQRGNALFLILIAVALFAALSYAVTQSGRGGGGGTSRETATINAGLITDFPAAVRTAVTRMILTGPPTATTIEYKYGTTGAAYGAANTVTGAVFESTVGGGVTYVAPPSAGVDSSTAAGFAGGNWRFKAIPTGAYGWFIKGIGSDGVSGMDSFAFIGVNDATCKAINGGLGFASQTAVSEGAVFTTTADATEALPSTTSGSSTQGNTNSLGKGLTSPPQSFACVANTASGSTTPFIYYHALIEQ